MAIPTTKDLLITSSKPLIIMAYTDGCPYCTLMKPIMEELESELKDTFTFSMLNVEESLDLANSLAVTGVPTFIFFKNTQEVARTSGSMQKEELKNIINETLA